MSTTWGLKVPASTDAPDGPGAILDLASSVETALGSRRAVVQQTGGATASTSGIDLTFGTTLSDPSGMVSGVGFQCLWNGLYRFGCRAAVNGGDIGNTSAVFIDCIDSSSGAVYGQVGQWGMASDMPMQYVDEHVFTAGAKFRFRLRWNGGASRGISYGSDSVQPRAWIQYLGPA